MDNATTAETASSASGCATSRGPAPFIRIARDIVTTCRTGFSCDATWTYGAMLAVRSWQP